MARAAKRLEIRPLRVPSGRRRRRIRDPIVIERGAGGPRTFVDFAIERIYGLRATQGPELLTREDGKQTG